MLLLLLACSGPAAPAPAPPVADAPPVAASPAAVPPAAPAVGAFPPELVGTWVRLTAREGRWVVHQPCGEVLPRLSIPAGDGPVRFEVGQDEWTGSPVSLAPSADGWTLTARAPAGADEVHTLQWYDASRRRLRWDGQGPFVTDAEAELTEHVIDPVTECYDDPGAGDPLADLSRLPPRLWRIADLDGWRRPPDSGTVAELELDTVSRPPRLLRRSGAGERVSTVLAVTPDGDGWRLTVDGEGRGRWGLWIGPWTPLPPPVLPPLADPEGKVATPTPDPSTTPAPPGAWQVRVGSQRGAGVAWVTSLEQATR